MVLSSPAKPGSGNADDTGIQIDPPQQLLLGKLFHKSGEYSGIYKQYLISCLLFELILPDIHNVPCSALLRFPLFGHLFIQLRQFIGPLSRGFCQGSGILQSLQGSACRFLGGFHCFGVSLPHPFPLLRHQRLCLLLA